MDRSPLLGVERARAGARATSRFRRKRNGSTQTPEHTSGPRRVLRRELDGEAFYVGASWTPKEPWQGRFRVVQWSVFPSSDCVTQPSHPLPLRPVDSAPRDARVASFATRQQREAWKQAHHCIPPELLRARPGRRARLVAPVVFPLVERLSKGKLGYCYATEHAMRIMAWVDSGHVYGERSISRRLRQEHRRGGLRRVVIPRGRPAKWAPHGHNGTTTNRFPSEGERRERLWRMKREKQKQRREARARERATKMLSAAAPLAPAPPAPPRTALAPLVVPTVEERFAPGVLPPGFLETRQEPEPPEDYAAARDRQLAAARAARHLWLDDWLDDLPDE
jgi:hypothetical protein